MGDEQSRWALAVNKHIGKLEGDLTTIEGEAAARGFAFLPGKSQFAEVMAGEEYKRVLSEENAAIFKEFRERIFQVVQAVEKYRLAVAKLSLNLYRERELNRVALLNAEFEDSVDRHKTDITRGAAEIEARNYDVIRLRALTEREMNYWKEVAIESEGESLDAETELAQARLSTAQERLKIINYLKDAISAETAVVESEKTKLAVLDRVADLQESLATAKLGMVPLYENKAAAKTKLASATSEEVLALKALANLGIDRAALKEVLWEAEASYLTARLGLAAQDGAREIAQLNADLARSSARNEIQAAQNLVREAVASAKAGLEKDQVVLKYSLANLRRQGEIAAVLATAGTEAELVSGGYSASASSILNRGETAAGIIRSSAVTERNHTTNTESEINTTKNATYTYQRRISG